LLLSLVAATLASTTTTSPHARAAKPATGDGIAPVASGYATVAIPSRAATTAAARIARSIRRG
jgi:hypothetical protein